MIDAADWKETGALFRNLSSGCGLENGQEFKKSRMEYFGRWMH